MPDGGNVIVAQLFAKRGFGIFQASVDLALQSQRKPNIAGRLHQNSSWIRMVPKRPILPLICR